ncbi:hypothetical protein YC2023_081429 [Brassica napus]
MVVVYFGSVYEVLVVGSLKWFLRVLGGSGLAAIWPRIFPPSNCQRCSTR